MGIVKHHERYVASRGEAVGTMEENALNSLFLIVDGE